MSSVLDSIFSAFVILGHGSAVDVNLELMKIIMILITKAAALYILLTNMQKYLLNLSDRP